jgi:hypothetical protein
MVTLSFILTDAVIIKRKTKGKYSFSVRLMKPIGAGWLQKAVLVHLLNQKKIKYFE